MCRPAVEHAVPRPRWVWHIADLFMDAAHVAQVGRIAKHTSTGELGRAQLATVDRGVLQQQSKAVDLQRHVVPEQRAQHADALGQQALVGVQHQHPVAPHALERLVARRGKTVVPVESDETRAVLAGNVRCAVRGARVDADDHLIHQAPNRVEHPVQQVPFVVRNGTQRQAHGRPAIVNVQS